MRICSTRPVHDPHDDEALVCLRTSSSVNRPFALIAFTIVPLHTPLQPQTSAVSAIPAARLWPWWPVVAEVGLAEHQPVAERPHRECRRAAA
jgi:hypothetical protein